MSTGVMHGHDLAVACVLVRARYPWHVLSLTSSAWDLRTFFSSALKRAHKKDWFARFWFFLVWCLSTEGAFFLLVGKKGEGSAVDVVDTEGKGEGEAERKGERKATKSIL